MKRVCSLVCLVILGCNPTQVPVDAGSADAARLDAPAADTGASPSGAAQLLAEMGRVACAAVRACSVADLGFAQSEGSIARCEARFAEEHAYLLTSPNVAFDASSSAGCLAAFDPAACELGRAPSASTLEWPSACRAALHGTVAVGAACTSSAECAAGQCTCAGVCVAEGALGDECSSAPCGPGTMCDATGHCVASPSMPHAGEACLDLGSCFGALRCSSGVCREVRDLRAASLGDACLNPFDSSADVDPAVWCAQGLWCDYDGGSVCAASPAAGDACVGQGTCPEGFACQGSPTVCAAMQPLGGDCPSADACGPRLVCTFSICEAMKALGETCNGGAECFSGVCNTVCILPERAFCP